MIDFEWGRISTKIYLKKKQKTNVSLYGFVNLKLKTSSQLATKVTSFEIKKKKRQYQSFHFSNFYTSQYLIYSINLHPQITRIGSPPLTNWGASCPCYRSTGFTLVVTIHKPLILKKENAVGL